MALLLLSGLSFASVMPAVTMAQGTPIARPSPRDPYADHVTEASRRFGVPIAWIRAVMRGESAGDSHAISSAGAKGLMQIMPDTWAGLRLRYGLGRDPFDPHDNILAGAAYLREMWDRYGDVAAMLAAYNAGPARYDEHRATGRPLPAETRAYVAALAPIMLGERPSAGAAGTARPPDWREAALFVVRVIDVSAADLTPPERAPDAARSPVPATSNTFPAPQSLGLFVARNTGGDQP
jgi:soluble lytic murein transglycosylase-like protein